MFDSYDDMEKKFRRDISSLNDIFDFVHDFLILNHIDDAVRFSIDFMVEELFTNMVKYNPGNSNDILINITKIGSRLTLSLTDFDVDPFDLTKTAEVDVTRSLAERKVGGLGIHLVKKMVDDIDYEYVDRMSKITVTKNLEK